MDMVFFTRLWYYYMTLGFKNEVFLDPFTMFQRSIDTSNIMCLAPLHEECPKHHGHKGDPEVTPKTCGAVGREAIL